MTEPVHPPVEHCATIVVGNAVTKIDGLAVVALTAKSSVQNPRTSRPFVPLVEGAWAEIEIPKFGEPPPLAIDVYSTISGDHAKLQALSLMTALAPATGWNMRPDFTI